MSPFSIDDETKEIIMTFTGGVPWLLEVLFAQIKETKWFQMDYLAPHPKMYEVLEQHMSTLISRHPDQLQYVCILKDR